MKTIRARDFITVILGLSTSAYKESAPLGTHSGAASFLNSKRGKAWALKLATKQLSKRGLRGGEREAGMKKPGL
jgi:hypothetical protein